MSRRLHGHRGCWLYLLLNPGCLPFTRIFRSRVKFPIPTTLGGAGSDGDQCRAQSVAWPEQILRIKSLVV